MIHTITTALAFWLLLSIATALVVGPFIARGDA